MTGAARLRDPRAPVGRGEGGLRASLPGTHRTAPRAPRRRGPSRPLPAARRVWRRWHPRLRPVSRPAPGGRPESWRGQRPHRGGSGQTGATGPGCGRWPVPRPGTFWQPVCASVSSRILSVCCRDRQWQGWLQPGAGKGQEGEEQGAATVTEPSPGDSGAGSFWDQGSVCHLEEVPGGTQCLDSGPHSGFCFLL